MWNVFYKTYKEFFAEKYNIFLVTVPSVVYLVYKLVYAEADFLSTYLVLFNFSIFYVYQIAPRMLFLEKRNKTLETLIATPLDFKSIFWGNFLVLFTVINLVNFVALIAGCIYYINIGDIASLKAILYNFFTIIITIANFTYFALMSSIKSKNQVACALKLPFISILFLIPNGLIAVYVNYLEMNILLVTSVFMLYSIVLFVVGLFINRKLFYKPTLLTLLGKVEW